MAMKIKKWIWIVSGIFLILLAAIGYFVATFDADRYRPLVIQKISEAVGAPVRLGKVSLGWRGGIAIQLSRLEIGSEPPPGQEPAVAVEKVLVGLKPLPLLRGDLQSGTVVLQRPKAHVVLGSDRTIEVEGLSASGPAAGGSRSAGAPGVASSGDSHGSSGGGIPLLLIGLLEVRDGTLLFTDQSAKPPRTLALEQIGLSLRPESIQGPFSIRLQLALFAPRPNVRFSGEVAMPLGGRPPSGKDLRLELDLTDLNLEEITRILPSFKDLGIQSPLAGTLQLDVALLDLSPKGLNEFSAKLRCSGGRIHLSRLGIPLEQVTLQAGYEKSRLDVGEASAKMGSGTVSIHGAVDQIFQEPKGNILVDVKELPLDLILPELGVEPASLQGRLTTSLEASFQGEGWWKLIRDLTGKGTIRLEEGRLRKFNLLREILGRLTVLPGLVETLAARLPESYREKLQAQDTVLEPVELRLSAGGQQVNVEGLRLATDSFEMSGSGRIGFNGSVQIPAQIRIEPQLAEAMIRSVEELRLLADDQGRLIFPVVLQGKLPQLAVVPDVGYVTQRLLSSKGQELIGGLLQKFLEKDSSEKQQ